MSIPSAPAPPNTHNTHTALSLSLSLLRGRGSATSGRIKVGTHTHKARALTHRPALLPADTISNPNPESGVYSTEFADESGEYFDMYAEVQTRYSQVYWTRSPDIALPKDIIERFEGKVMAITGYEVDQVMKTPDGDKSVPIYNAYNHHYFGWLMGDHSEMFKLDAPKEGQNPTMWDIRDTEDKPVNQSFPTNIVFKENPGGEYRKSYHGYPHGYAQLLHSPKKFVCEPMQIDTHNRKYGATDAVGYEVATTKEGEQFLPQNVITGGENLGSGLSPLIECPCSTRITRSTKNSSAILTAQTCGTSLIKSEEECAKAVARVAPVASSASVSNSSMAYGCTMRPAGDGSYVAVFNSANTTHACGSPPPASRGPFTWQTKGNVTISCGGKGLKPCLPPSEKYGCAAAMKGQPHPQCIWKSEEAAQKGCAEYEECGAYFCSTRYSLPGLALLPKGKKGPLLCFGREDGATTASPGETAFVKDYTNPQPAAFLQGAALESLHGPSLVNLTMKHDGKTAEITMTGPAGKWFGVGFNAQNMADQPYAIIVDGNGKITERKLGPHRPGTVLAASVKITSSSTIDGMRKVVLSRPVPAKTKDHFAIPVTPGQINLITAVGDTVELAYHKHRTGAIITLLPTKVDSCLCAPTTTEYLTYMNSSTAAFHYNCIEEPRGDMAHGQRLHDGQLIANGKKANPACAYDTYHGGLRCCQHTWFLTDLEQNASIPDEVDTYYLKWRFYFQEYTEAKPVVAPFPAVPASHQHIHHWVSKNGVVEPFIYKNETFYQDRLGTNIGKTPKKGTVCFSSGLPHRRASQRLRGGPLRAWH